MESMARIESALHAAVASGEAQGCPPKLAAAVRHAVFPGGARIRPQLCLAVAEMEAFLASGGEAAADALQETFARVFQKIGSLAIA